LERILLGVGSRFNRSNEDGHRNKLAPAAWSSKPLGRRKRKRHALFIHRECEVHVALPFQTFARDAVEPRTAALERLVDQFVFAIVKAALLEAHASAELAEETHIVPRLTQWRDRLLGDLCIEMPICALNVLRLKEGRRWQNDIGVVGRIGKELFVNHGEEV